MGELDVWRSYSAQPSRTSRRELDRIFEQANLTNARVEANLAKEVACQQASMAAHMTAMMGAMNLWDAGMGMAQNDPAKQQIAGEYTRSFLNDSKLRLFWKKWD